MRNCYIFSNCLRSNPQQLETNLRKLNCTKDDIFVFMNNAVMLYGCMNFFRDFPHIHLFMRSCSCIGVVGYFGFNKAFECNKYETVIGVHPTDKVVNLDIGTRETSKNTKKDVELPELVDYIAKTNHMPTTGYLSYYLSKVLFKANNYILVNYYGNEDNSTCKDPSHDWQYENEWLKTMNRIFV